MLIQIYYDTKYGEIGIREENSILFTANKYGNGLQCNHNGDTKEYDKVKSVCFEIENKIKELIKLNEVK